MTESLAMQISNLIIARYPKCMGEQNAEACVELANVVGPILGGMLHQANGDEEKYRRNFIAFISILDEQARATYREALIISANGQKQHH